VCDPFSRVRRRRRRSGDGIVKEGHGQIPLSVHFMGVIMIMKAHLGVFRDCENFKIPMGASPHR
jgi:hypothetical protein